VVERLVDFDWVGLVRQRAAAADRPVEVRLPRRRVCVRADPDALGLVLDELLANAAKFTPPDAPIVVRVALEPVEGDRDARQPGCVTTTVEDGGPGIPPGDRDRVFDRFTRLGDHLTRPQQGVGLGLYIARRTVEAMGGTVACEASPLGGAAFVLRLGLPRVSSPRS
jgi:two-component system sensor histidine kinase KdpD